MATVKRGNVPPTHPTVWTGLALAVVGLLLAVFAYTGSRVYEITYAFVALAGAFLALAGIFTAAWGRSIMSARASRSRRAGISADALAMARPGPEREELPPVSSEDAPTVAAPKDKKRLPFSLPRRAKKKEERREAPIPAGALRDEPAPVAYPTPAPLPPVPALAPDEPLVTLSGPVRATLRCPQCGATFAAEGARPFQATCASCGFSATV